MTLNACELEIDLFCHGMVVQDNAMLAMFTLLRIGKPGAAP